MPELNSSTLLFQKPDFEIKITTFHGLESVLSNELVKLGGRNVIEFKRGVSVTGDWGFVYKCNYCLRTAIKVLVPICEFTARQADELYTAVNAIAWEQLFSNEHSFAVESVLRSDYFNNSMYCNQRVKDAIVDRFRRETGKRPNVDRKEIGRAHV